MGLSLLLIIIGIALAILVHYGLGIALHPDRPGLADLAASDCLPFTRLIDARSLA